MKMPRPRILPTISAWLVFALATASLAAAGPQEETAADGAQQEASAEPTTEEIIGEYLELVKDKKKSTEVQVALEKLGRIYAQSMEQREQIQLQLDRKQGDTGELKRQLRDGDRLRTELAAEVWKAFRFRTRDNAGNKKIWAKAVWVLGGMPEHGSKYLWQGFEDKRFSKDSKAQADCIRQIGRTKDYEQFEQLLNLLKHHDNQVIAAAAQAFQNYSAAPGKIRQECTKRLVKQLESFDNEARGGGSSSAGRRLGATKGPMIRALKVLTGESYDDSLAWTRFWNKNKSNRKLWKD